MLSQIQRFGGAMFTPVLLFPFAGIVVGLAILLQNPMFEIVIKIGRLQSILVLYNQFMPVLFSINDLTSCHATLSINTIS